MGKTYRYTNLFKQAKYYDYKFWDRLEANLYKYRNYVADNPIHITKYSEGHWHSPFNSKLREDLYCIIIYIAKITGVKIMWKESISEFENETERHLLLVGENDRVIICHHILNYTIEGIYRFEEYLRKNERDKSKRLGYSNITQYLKLKVSQRVFHICDVMRVILVEDQEKINRLENYIMGRYKLDYKKYGQINMAYWNAVSGTFHNKRMML